MRDQRFQSCRRRSQGTEKAASISFDTALLAAYRRLTAVSKTGVVLGIHRVLPNRSPPCHVIQRSWPASSWLPRWSSASGWQCAASPTAASAASSPVWLSWWGTEGPVQIYYTSMTCQGGHLTTSHTGYIDVDAGLFAPANLHYNWAEELQMYTSTGWKHVSWSATHSGSGNALDLHQRWIPTGMYQPLSFRAFFYIQNPPASRLRGGHQLEWHVTAPSEHTQRRQPRSRPGWRRWVASDDRTRAGQSEGRCGTMAWLHGSTCRRWGWP